MSEPMDECPNCPFCGADLPEYPEVASMLHAMHAKIEALAEAEGDEFEYLLAEVTRFVGA